MSDRYEEAVWLEWSGLPARINKIRSGAWSVFKKLIELDCRAHRRPEAVEVSLDELGERCGLTAEAVERIIKALVGKKILHAFIPDNPDEVGLFEIRLPIETPLAPPEVAQRAQDPRLRNTSLYRYARVEEELPLDEKRVQQIIDHYLNHLSQKINAFIIEQIEIAARRFPLESILRTIERGADHNIRSMGWVIKELIRDHTKQERKKKMDTRP
jgi:hypothetical protein